jgi:hypothetical protein
MFGRSPSAMQFMPSEPLHNALYDIRDNISLAQEFVAGWITPLLLAHGGIFMR